MSDGHRLRVMTYNVRTLRGDVGALTAIVQDHAPDVLLVQEAPRFLRWRSKRAALARRSGLVVATTDRPGGLCIMTSLRVDLVSTSFTLLAKTEGEPQRALVSATVSVLGTRWRLATTQLSADATERLAALDDARTTLPDDGAALVLGGDVAGGPGGAADAVILAGPRVVVESCEVVTDPRVGRAGRHRPVVAVLSIAPSPR